MKILWDKYEAALLLKACIEIENGRMSLKDAISDISKKLRSRAIVKGINIDDKYRNENGINMQLKAMNYCYHHKDGGLSKSKVFYEIVSIYESNPEEFNMILNDTLTTPSPDKWEWFLGWLSNKTANKKDKKDKIVTALTDLSELAIQQKVIGVPINLETDVKKLERLRFDISKRNRVIFSENQLKQRCLQALDLYITFIRTINEKTSSNLNKRVIKLLKKHDGVREIKPNYKVNSLKEQQANSKIIMREDFYKWLEDNKGINRDRGVQYINNLLGIENFAKALGYNSVEFLTTNVDLLKSSYSILQKSKEFDTYNLNRNNEPLRAISFWFEYNVYILKERIMFQPKIIETAKKIMMERFTNGLRVNSSISKKKFLAAFYDLTGEQFPDNVVYESLIQHIGIKFDEKIYFISEDAKKQLEETVNNAINSGNNILYYEEIYQQMLPFMSNFGIFSAELLKEVLKDIFPQMSYHKKYFKPHEDDNLETDIIACFIKEKFLMTCSEIKNRLFFTDTAQIRNTCNNSKKIVWVKEDTFALMENISIHEDDINRTNLIIEKDIREHGFSVIQKVAIDKSAEENPDITDSALREAIFNKVLSDRYSRKYSIITTEDSDFSISDFLKEYCLQLNEINLSDLETYEEKLTDKKVNSLDVAYNNMIRVSKDKFVNPDMLNFNIQEIDRAISLFVQGEIVPLCIINSFSSFPHLEGFAWNLFLLDSYCKHRSVAYRTLGGPAKSRPVGAIYPSHMQFDNYEQLLSKVIAFNDIELDEESVNKFLIKHFFILRKFSSKSIKTIIYKAQELRSQEDNQGV